MQLIYVVVGITILLVGVWFVRKEHLTSGLICVIIASAFFLLDPVAFQGFLKTGFINILNSYGKQINKLQNTLISQQQELDKQHTEIKKSQSDISDTQKQIIKQQKDIDAQQKKILDQQVDISSTQKHLNEQQEKLENVESLVKELFKNTRIEIAGQLNKDKMFWGKVNNYWVYVYNEEGTQERYFIINPDHVSILFSLDHIPIRESIKLQYHIYQQPPSSYFLLVNNILWFTWGDSESRLKSNNFYVSYVVDPEKKILNHNCQ